MQSYKEYFEKQLKEADKVRKEIILKELKELNAERIIIFGNPITKKNHSQIIKAGNRHMLIPSKQYKAYERDFVVQCMKIGVSNKNLSKRLNIACVYYMKTKRKVDLTNLLSATMDCLVKAKVIEDDNCNIACSHDGSRVFYDKDNPRVEITISEV